MTVSYLKVDFDTNILSGLPIAVKEVFCRDMDIVPSVSGNSVCYCKVHAIKGIYYYRVLLP